MHKEWCQAIKNWLSKHVLLGWVGQASLAHADPGLRTTSPMRISYICRRSQKLHPTFKTDSDTQRANEVFIKKFSQRKDQSHGFIPPLRDFTNNSNVFSKTDHITSSHAQKFFTVGKNLHKVVVG